MLLQEQVLWWSVGRSQVSVIEDWLEDGAESRLITSTGKWRVMASALNKVGWMYGISSENVCAKVRQVKMSRANTSLKDLLFINHLSLTFNASLREWIPLLPER